MSWKWCVAGKTQVIFELGLVGPLRLYSICLKAFPLYRIRLNSWGKPISIEYTCVQFYKLFKMIKVNLFYVFSNEMQ